MLDAMPTGNEMKSPSLTFTLVAFNLPQKEQLKISIIIIAMIIVTLVKFYDTLQ